MLIRSFDIMFATIAIVILLPLLIFTACLLRLTGEGEVFYRQLRIGYNGDYFNIIKFATMLKNSADIGSGTITVKNDYRVLPVGSILRKTKINELPQLFNILLGDMSFIGPRPQDQRCFDAFTPTHQKVIKNCVPGLSGLGSIYFRNEEELLDGASDPGSFYDHVVMPYKGELECYFFRHMSVSMYFKLIFLTILEILLPNKIDLNLLFKNLPVAPHELLGRK